jgi:hypothetical protein
VFGDNWRGYSGHQAAALATAWTARGRQREHRFNAYKR